jgi:hypothetical protein
MVPMEHYPVPLLKVAVIIVWLSNADGSIVAEASGVSVDLPTCKRLAAEKIAEESGNPDLVGSTAHFSCWNTRSNVDGGEHRSAPGIVEL